MPKKNAPALTPPHLAQPELRYSSAADADTYYRAVFRGFHDDYVPENWAIHEPLVEPERDFGFVVGDTWIATCGAYTRTMSLPGGAMLPIGAVTVVTVNPAYRRRGLLRKMMEHQLADIHRRGEAIALLWASESVIYGRFGYGHAVPRLSLSGQTRSSAFLPRVEVGSGSVGEVDVDTYRAVVPALREKLLTTRPGALNRTEAHWSVQVADPESWRRGASFRRLALHYDEKGVPDGWATFRIKHDETPTGPNGEVRIEELEGLTPAAHAALWRFLLDLDLVRRFSKRGGAIDEPLRYLVADQRAIKADLEDSTYARVVDLKKALEARSYASDLDVVVGVTDPMFDHNDGAFRLVAADGTMSVTKARRKPDLTLDIREVGSIYLGGVALTALHAAGLVTERTPGSVQAVTAAFAWSRQPFCPDGF